MIFESINNYVVQNCLLLQRNEIRGRLLCDLNSTLSYWFYFLFLFIFDSDVVVVYSLKFYWVYWHTIIGLFLVGGGTYFVQIGLGIIQSSLRWLILWSAVWWCIISTWNYYVRYESKIFSLVKSLNSSKLKNIVALQVLPCSIFLDSRVRFSKVSKIMLFRTICHLQRN